MIKSEAFFRILGDETRLRCLVLLLEYKELCVCQLTQALQLTQPKVSRHLAMLRRHNLLIQKREGLWVYYRVNPDLPKWAMQIINILANQIKTLQPYQLDIANVSQFKKLSSRNIMRASQQCIRK